MSFDEVREEVMQEIKKDFHVIPKQGIITDGYILDLVTAVVCDEYKVSLEAIKSKSRKDGLPPIRFKIWYLAKKIKPNIGIRFIGRQFGKQSDNAHSVVIYGITQVEGDMKIYPKEKAIILDLELKIKDELEKCTKTQK